MWSLLTASWLVCSFLVCQIFLVKYYRLYYPRSRLRNWNYYTGYMIRHPFINAFGRDERRRACAGRDMVHETVMQTQRSQCYTVLKGRNGPSVNLNFRRWGPGSCTVLSFSGGRLSDDIVSSTRCELCFIISDTSWKYFYWILTVAYTPRD